MKRLTRFTSLVLLAVCGASSTPLAAQTNAESAGLEFPPEWMPHEAVWMGWSDDTRHHPVQVQMIEAMAPHVPIRMMVTSDSVRAHAMETLQAAGIDTGAVEYVVHPIPNFWTRDPGPLFLSDGASLAVAGFRWGEYGYPAERQIGNVLLSRRGEIAGDVAERMGLETRTTDLVAEGGGRPFHVVTLPAPALHHYMWTGPLAEWMTEFDPFDAVYRDFELGDEIHWVPAMSYMNFFVTNDVVLVARYWREGLPERERENEEARAKLQELFPDREIVQIDPLSVNRAGGGMHCIVQQQPKVGP